MRTYVGSIFFICYISFWITFFIFHITGKSLDVYLLYAFFGSILILSIIFYKFSSDQKLFFMISGETHMCFALSYILSEIIPLNVSPYFDNIFFFSSLLLLVLGYHFIINRKDVNDFNIQDIMPDAVPLAIGTLCICGIFAFRNRNILFSLVQPHLPSFEQLVVLGLAAFTEEIISRYYIQGVSLKAFHPAYAILFSSILFSLLHFFTNVFELQIFFFHTVHGIIYGYTYYKSENNLSVPLILHFFNNVFILSFQ